jgi:hypothetical protein
MQRLPAYAVLAMFFGLPALVCCGNVPNDVAAFQERRTQCDHFRGEDAYDKERERLLLEQLKKYCAGTDAELARLKKKYARDEAVTNSLKSYEDRIE